MSYDTEIKKELEKKERRQRIINHAQQKVFMYPSGSPDRWRNGVEVLMQVRPQARIIYKQIAEQAEAKRKMFGADNLFAATKAEDGSVMRYTMALPPFLMECLKLCDPEYFIGKGSRALSDGKHLRKMKQAFPEFFVPEVI